jgi:hypothetical protein
MKPGEIRIKNNIVLGSLLRYSVDPTLVEIIGWLALLHGITITEGWRRQRHSNDLHGVVPVRAIDVRSWDYPDPEAVAREINETWQYDPERPEKQCCVLHDIGEGMHLHIQVHPNTRRIRE